MVIYSTVILENNEFDAVVNENKCLGNIEILLLVCLLAILIETPFYEITMIRSWRLDRFRYNLPYAEMTGGVLAVSTDQFNAGTVNHLMFNYMHISADQWPKLLITIFRNLVNLVTIFRNLVKYGR